MNHNGLVKFHEKNEINSILLTNDGFNSEISLQKNNENLNSIQRILYITR